MEYFVRPCSTATDVRDPPPKDLFDDSPTHRSISEKRFLVMAADQLFFCDLGLRCVTTRWCLKALSDRSLEFWLICHRIYK